MIETPDCPICDQPPQFVLADGHQNFCGNDSCPVLAWDSHLPRAELLAHPETIMEKGS